MTGSNHLANAFQADGEKSKSQILTNFEIELSASIQSFNAQRVGEICDYLRYKRGMSYKDQTELVVKLNCSPADFEDLLYQADEMDNS